MNKLNTDQHDQFMSAIKDLEWIKGLGRWVMGLCMSVICLVIVGIFWAGTLYKQVEVNAESIRRYHVLEGGFPCDEIQIASTDKLLLQKI